MLALAAKLEAAAWKTLGFLVAAGLVIGFFAWMTTNPDRFKAVAGSAGNAGASVAITSLDWVAEKAGGDAATADVPSVQTVWVENKAPARWPVKQAIATWDKGLTTVQLRLGPCHDGAPCIKVSEVADLEPTDGHVTLGKTSRFLGTSVKFNRAAVGHVPARYRTVSAVHELGHALGLKHSDDPESVMYATVGAKSAASPSGPDIDAVDAKFGHG